MGVFGEQSLEEKTIEFFKQQADYRINKFQDEDLLKSFLFSNFSQPKYKVGDYVEGYFSTQGYSARRMLGVIRSIEKDVGRCCFLYAVCFYFNDKWDLTFQSEQCLKLQESEEKTDKNYFSRSDKERYQYLKMKSKFSNRNDS